MELHNLKPAKGAIHREKRIARGEGSGHGGTATKGHKGAKSRSGVKVKRGFEGGQTPMHRRLPKIGFKNISRIEFRVINLDQLADYAQLNDTKTFDSEIFNQLGVCKPSEKIKLLARGEAAANLNLKVHACSQAAMDKIKAAGGSVELI
ncbi:MAG: 50S ribosomal protein L15 [Saprospiraceae bacterium]|jgi:large subunit ribosomal protein L15|nr:50S ribosomal protein L15 [Candidatus Vicinibacter proximus]MBL7824049.1 50S ribosomal protein L15 [Saprospiraceae bacterium]MCC6842141.1 50S ribosomal protein L15 [Saprospiraceae bacterium]HRG32835.1 50S ribosomal protein L15 [Saprospiraceae bacterium]